MWQLIVSIFIAEGLRAQIIFGTDNAPGEHGFDPFNLMPKDPEKAKLRKLQEIKHGRIAMIAVVGFYAQIKVTGGVWPFF